MIIVKSVHTLNARECLMLEVIRNYFNFESRQMFHLAQGMRMSVEEALSNKGINYDKLRSALVPAQDRREVALVFDTAAIDSNLYGFDVMKQVIPLFHKKSNHSVLVGDYRDRPGEGERLYEAFKEGIELRRDVEYLHPAQFYFVYINNLTPGMVRHFDQGLSNYVGFAGIADMTYSSTLKTCLSNMLVNRFIKHKQLILQGHEPDRQTEDNVNTCGFPFEENGYVCRSISDDLMKVFLSYKIERPVYPGFKEDTEFALNSVGSKPTKLGLLDVEIKKEKFKYVMDQKAESIKRAGLKNVTRQQLAAMIKAKIESTYIYNLRFDEEHKVTKFNVILEVQGGEECTVTRLLAALEYQPDRRKIRLVTLY